MPTAILSIRGKENEFSVIAELPQKAIDAMRADEIEVGIVENHIPAWVVAFGPTRIWCFFQDIWNLKNPFRD